MPHMEVQSWPKIQDMVSPVEARSWPKRWQCMINRSSKGDHRGGFGHRGDVAEVILARDLGVSAAWGGAESDADPGGGN